MCKNVRRFCAALLFSLALITIAGRVQAAEDPQDGRVPLYLKAVDPNGGKLFFTWRQLEGPKVRIADPSATKSVTEDGKQKWVTETYFIPTEAGTYKFEVSVKNENGEEAKKVISRDVLPPSPPPVAVAGKDKTAQVGQVVVLNGIDSKAGPGRAIAEWEWTAVQKPDKAKAIDPKKLKERQFDFKADEAGVYQFELRVFDGKRWSDTSRVIVTIKPVSAPPKIEDDNETVEAHELETGPKIAPNKAKPVIKAVVADGGDLKLGESVVLDGSASAVDVKLKPEFRWHQEKGPLAKTLTPDKNKPFAKDREDPANYPVWKFTPDKPGEYVFTLEITAHDPDSKDPIVTKSEHVTFNVGGGNHPPVAKIFLVRDTAEVGEQVKLDGSLSKDEDKGDKLQYMWGPVAGKRAPKNWSGVEGPKVEFTADEDGEYAVQLTVTDGKEKSTDEVTITVGKANQPPKISLPRTYTGITKESVLIEAEVKDPESDRFDCKWTCVDPADLKIPDALARNQQLKFMPNKPGSYMFKLTVTDANGHVESATTMVVVKDGGAASPAPTAVLKGPVTCAVGEKVRISGAQSAPGGKDRKTLTYEWKQELVEGGPKISSKPPGEKDKFWEFTPTEEGKYVISLSVFDGAQRSEPERYEVTAVKDHPAPVAKVAVPESMKLEIGQSLFLDGSESHGEGDKLTFKWKKAGGNAEVEIGGADTEKCKVTAKTAGTVEIELVVNDGVRESAAERVELTVGKAKPARGKPVAIISGLETARAGALVELSGAKSHADEGAEITTYIWSQAADGGPGIGLEGKELRKREIKFKAEKNGTYVLSLKVVDSEGQSSESVTHKIEVKGVNRPPKAVGSIDASGPVAIGKEVKLSARGSLDPEGGPLKYRWKQLTGTPVQLPDEGEEIVNIVPTAAGEYDFELIVSDGENESPPAKVSFSVKAANTPPVAVIAAVTPVEPGEKIVLDGTESKDADGDKLEYRWTKVSGPDVKFPWRGDRKPKVEVALDKEGEYVFELKVFDGKEPSEPAKVTAKTRAGNQAPSAVIAEPTVRSEENAETILDGSASADPDNGPKPLTYIWKQIEGTPKVEAVQDGALLKFTPKKMGNLKFELRVSDGKATSEPAIVSVAVLKAGSMPVAVPRAIPNPVKAALRTNRNDPNILELNATASTAGGENKKTPLTYTWKQVGGDDLHLKAAEMSKSRVGIRVFAPGKYRFQLVVSDGQNTSQPVFLDVDVIENDGAAPASNKDGAKEHPPEKESSAPDNKHGSATRKPAIRASDETEQADLKAARAQGDDGALLPPPRDNTKVAMTDDTFQNPTADGDKESMLHDLKELARSNSETADKVLTDALSSDDKDIRDTAARSLYQRGINSIPALITVLEGNNDKARKEAHWALKELTKESFGPSADEWKQWWAQQKTAAKK